MVILSCVAIVDQLFANSYIDVVAEYESEQAVFEGQQREISKEQIIESKKVVWILSASTLLNAGTFRVHLFIRAHSGSCQYVFSIT